MKISLIHKRLLLLNLILFFFVIIIPIHVLYRYSINYIYNSIHDYNITKVQNISNMIDKTIEDIMKIPIEKFSDLITNEELITPLYRDISRDPMAIKEVNDTLTSFENQNQKHKLRLYYTNGKILFYNSTVNFLNSISVKKVLPPQWIDRIIDEGMNIRWTIEEEENGKYVAYIRTIPFFGKKEQIKGIIGVYYNIQYLYETIENYLVSNKINQQFIIVNDEELVVSYPNQMNNIALNDITSQINTDNHKRQNLYEINLNNEKYLVSILSSKHNTWKYISLVSLASYYKTADRFNTIYYTIVLLIVLANIIGIFWSTYKAYKPIKNIAQIFKGLYQEDIEKDEYDFIIDSASHVESRIDELKNKINKYQPLIQSNLIWELLTNTKNNIEQDIFKASGIILDKNKHCCIILKVYHHSMIQNKILLNYKIIDVINKMKTDDNNYTVLNNNNDLVILINYQNHLDEIINKLKNIIDTYTQDRYTLCVGEEVQAVSHITQSYQNANKVLKWIFFRCNDKIITYKDISSKKLNPDGSAFKLLNQIEDKLNNCKIEETKHLIDRLIAGLKHGNYKIQYCENTVLELCSRIRGCFIERGFKSDELLGYDVREMFYRVEDIEKLHEKINEVITKIIGCIVEKKDLLPIDLENKIDQYIENNIFNDINLEEMASYLNMNYESLSKHFKELKGITFSKYIISLKMRHAKKLLLNTELTVAEISNQLGYNTTSYFISLFKKKYNQTPLQYKKLNSR